MQFPVLNGVAVGNQILENVLLAFNMSEATAIFRSSGQITLNIQGWLDVGSSESKAKGSFDQKEFYFSNMGETALDCLKKSPEEH